MTERTLTRLTPSLHFHTESSAARTKQFALPVNKNWLDTWQGSYSAIERHHCTDKHIKDLSRLRSHRLGMPRQCDTRYTNSVPYWLEVHPQIKILVKAACTDNKLNRLLLLKATVSGDKFYFIIHSVSQFRRCKKWPVTMMVHVLKPYESRLIQIIDQEHGSNLIQGVENWLGLQWCTLQQVNPLPQFQPLPRVSLVKHAVGLPASEVTVVMTRPATWASNEQKLAIDWDYPRQRLRKVLPCPADWLANLGTNL